MLHAERCVGWQPEAKEMRTASCMCGAFSRDSAMARRIAYSSSPSMRHSAEPATIGPTPGPVAQADSSTSLSTASRLHWMAKRAMVALPAAPAGRLAAHVHVNSIRDQWRTIAQVNHGDRATARGSPLHRIWLRAAILPFGEGRVGLWKAHLLMPASLVTASAPRR